MPLSQISDDKRLEAISDLLIQFSLGNFDVQLPISENEDDIDAIIAGVNMLGEELNDVTISRDFLSRVYNSMTEMLFVAELNGTITDANEMACNQLKATKYDLIGTNLFDHVALKGHKKVVSGKNIFAKGDKALVNGNLTQQPEVALRCSFSMLRDNVNEPIGILLISEDISDQLATEKRIIRTIVETQEKERNRFASDLHDSLGQQLSGIRFYISALQHGIGDDENLINQFEKTLNGIDNAIDELRNICFNLMPRTLENHTLVYSINELASKLSTTNEMDIKLEHDKALPIFEKQFEIACFRIVQEFLNNAMRHGKASQVKIKICTLKREEELHIFLTDNGLGFDLETTTNKPGMGLRNIQTRVESYFGSMHFHSKKGEGTKLLMKFPLAFVILH
jgi:signal transduction histidine kinase